jgi:hypothetical protein
VLVFAASVVATGSVAVRAADEQSTALAKQFAALMVERHLDALAARDPQVADRFIAAMVFPEVQLLVVAARYPSPDYLQYQIDHKQYREAYTALYQNPIMETKLFFQDMGADGLRGGRGGLTDVMYERGQVQTVLDGNWKKARMSEAAYTQKLLDADTQYSGVLAILLDTLRADATQAGNKPGR